MPQVFISTWPRAACLEAALLCPLMIASTGMIAAPATDGTGSSWILGLAATAALSLGAAVMFAAGLVLTDRLLFATGRPPRVLAFAVIVWTVTATLFALALEPRLPDGFTGGVPIWFLGGMAGCVLSMIAHARLLFAHHLAAEGMRLVVARLEAYTPAGAGEASLTIRSKNRAS
jgi:drug/metabolite transporter (DMT)-like permease